MKTILCFILLIVIALPLFAQWSSDPSLNTEVCTMSGEQAIAKARTGPAGDTYIGYFSNEDGNYNVRLQRFDEAGTAQWTAGGILISDNTQMSWLTDWDMTVDQYNYAILTFQDIRTGNNNIYAYRISPSGDFTWGDNGLALSNTSAFDAAPKVIVTSANNVVVAWSSDSVSRLQKISSAGDLQWGSAGIEISGDNDYTWPQPIPVENDKIIVKYYEDSGPIWAPVRHIYAQKYDPEGNSVWSQPAAISTAGGISAQTQILPIIKDENNGIFMGWYDDRNEDMNYATYVQHVDSDGNCLFDTDGVLTSTNMDREHMYMFIAYIEEDQMLYSYWNEMDADQNQRGIYGQKIDMNGTRNWEEAGRPIIEISSTNVYPFGIGNTSEQVVIFFEEGSTESNVKAMALDENADFLWDGDIVTMCSVASEKLHYSTSSLFSSQWIVAWGDDRNGNRDIYAQNLNTDGTLGYNPHQIDHDANTAPNIIIIKPNPFSETTTISFLDKGFMMTRPEVGIYNIKGQLVKTLDASENRDGYDTVWHGKDMNGKNVNSGVYFCVVDNNKQKQIKKILLIR